jgi:hypothetical protein
MRAASAESRTCKIPGDWLLDSVPCLPHIYVLLHGALGAWALGHHSQRQATEDEGVRPGEARVGQKVRTLVAFAAYPEVTVGTNATVREVLPQKEDAETDVLFIHPHKWMNEKVMSCSAAEVELVY